MAPVLGFPGLVPHPLGRQSLGDLLDLTCSKLPSVAKMAARRSQSAVQTHHQDSRVPFTGCRCLLEVLWLSYEDFVRPKNSFMQESERSVPLCSAWKSLRQIRRIVS